MVTQGITQILGIIAGIFITRLLGAEGRGIYSIYLSDIGLFTMIFSFSINSAITFYVAGNKIQIQKLLGISLIFLIGGVLLTLLSTGIILFSPVSNLFFPEKTNSIFYILYFLISVITGLSVTIINGLIQGYKHFNIINKISLINSILNIGFFSLTFFLTHKKIITQDHIILVFSLTLFILLINALLWIYFLKQKADILKRPDFEVKEYLKPFIKYIGIIHLSIVLNFLNYRMDIWFINYYLKIKDVGIYSLAVNMAQLALFVTIPITSILVPHLTSANNENRFMMFKLYSKINFTIILLTNIFLYIFSDFIIPFLYGQEFAPAALPFRLLLFGSLLTGLSKMCGTYTFSINAVKYNLLSTIIGFLFTFIFDLLLIPVLGIIGACYASIISYAGVFIIIYLALNKHTGWKFENIFILTFTDIKKFFWYVNSK